MIKDLVRSLINCSLAIADNDPNSLLSEEPTPFMSHLGSTNVAKNLASVSFREVIAEERLEVKVGCTAVGSNAEHGLKYRTIPDWIGQSGWGSSQTGPI